MTRELSVKVFGKTQLPESNTIITYHVSGFLFLKGVVLHC
jgi:hypothetical protein